MEWFLLWRAGIRRHKGSILGIFLLLFLAALSLSSVLTVSRNAERYVRQEMERLEYGDLTFWVSGLEDVEPLAQELAAREEVARVGIQELIFSEYEADGQESDSEGQLIVYDPENTPYRIFSPDLSGYADGPASIGPGEILISPSLQSMFGLTVGDSITFPIARSGVDKVFTVAGFFEDPFMGSSMIGMKSFLICRQDYEEIGEMIRAAGDDSLARPGQMLHVTQAGELSAAELNRLLNEHTRLPRYTEFSHSADVLAGFMLTLQNVFTSLLLAFVVILLLVTLVVLSHSIRSGLEQDTANMGILKTLGARSRQLRLLQLAQYFTGIFPGMVLGLSASVALSALLCQAMVTTTGLRIPARLPAGLCAGALGAVLLLVLGFAWLQCKGITALSPVRALTGRTDDGARQSRSPMREKPLSLWLALRQLSTGKKRYRSVFLIAALLTFFASLTGRVDAWLGPDGEGLMDAFNPADLHIAAQPMGETSLSEVEQVITSYSPITDQYALAMPSVAVNGVDCTANVITQPQRFHMLQGRTCAAPDEIVLTEFMAADMDLAVGDTVTVTGALGSDVYTIAGIYQCANDMGANIGMSREGYVKIGEDTPQMWCEHYFLADPSRQPAIREALDNAFGGDVYIHENSWPGLYGILSAMQMLLLFQYAMAAVFILVVTLLTSQKLLRFERRDLSIYRCLGLPCGALRRSFALRFFLVSLLGSLAGLALAALATDPLVGFLMRLYGISNFSSHPGLESVLVPAAAVTLLFTLFAYLAAGKIRRASLTAQIASL